MLEFTSAYGCPRRGDYGVTKRPATSRLPAVRGRPRYRLNDAWSRHIVTVTIDMTDAVYQEWLAFWAQINYGADWFIMPLMMDLPEIYTSGVETYTVHATGPFSVNMDAHYVRTVSLELEVIGDTIFPETICDDIYGGPIDTLAPDDIYGGPIDALATDVIIPCPYVI